MIRYSEGSLRNIRGRAQLNVRSHEVNDETGEAGPWQALSKMTSIPYKDKHAAQTALLAWRDDLVGDAYVAAARAKGELRDEASIVDEVTKKLGINEDRLGLSFEQYTKEYIALKRKSRGVATDRGFKCSSDDILRLWLLPNLPSPTPAMRDITPEMIHTMLMKLAERGYSGNTILKAWTLFKSVCKYAVNMDGLRPDPCYGITNIKRPKARINHLDPRAADACAVQLSRAVQTDAVCAGRLALATGLECEALCGLTLGACDPRYVDAIHVHQVIAKAGNQWAIKRPKNDYRDRVIPLNDEICQIINDRKQQMAEEFNVSVDSLDSELFLLSNPAMKNDFLTPDKLRHHWHELSKLLGLKGNRGQLVTLHDLRHTFATSFLAKGGSFADLKAILGHSTGYMTLEVYAASDVRARAGSMRKNSRDLKQLQDSKDCEGLINALFDFSKSAELVEKGIASEQEELIG